MPAPDLPAPTLLAFDTSTEQLAVGVLAPSGRWLQQAPGGAAASAALLPSAKALFAQAGCTLQDVDAIAFGRGPGAFTGLRTSCAVAQGLAFGLSVPVLPIDSLMIVAEQARRLLQGSGAGVDVAVAADARMGEVYAGRYRWQGDRWQVLQSPGLWAPEALAQAWAADPPPCMAGSGLPLIGPALAGLGAASVPVELADDRADALLDLALQAWRAGAAVDAAEALPLYLRDKVAQTTAERAAARVNA